MHSLLVKLTFYLVHLCVCVCEWGGVSLLAVWNCMPLSWEIGTWIFRLDWISLQQHFLLTENKVLHLISSQQLLIVSANYLLDQVIIVPFSYFLNLKLCSQVWTSKKFIACVFIKKNWVGCEN